MSRPRQIRLGAFLQATGHHAAAWRHPDAQADAGHNIDHYRALAQTAERGLFDMVFVADSPGGWGDPNNPEAFSRDGKHAHFEPVTSAVPPEEYGESWHIDIDTHAPMALVADETSFKAGDQVTVEARSTVVLRRVF